MAYEIFFTEPRGLYVPTNSYLLIIHHNTTYKKLLIYLYSYNRGTYQTSVSVGWLPSASGCTHTNNFSRKAFGHKH